MTARVQDRLTVREMAREAHVSERLMAQGLRVARLGIPGIMSLVRTHGATIPELLLVVENLAPEAQAAWSALEPEDFHRAVRNLRHHVRETARVQSPTDELARLRARVAELEAEVRRLGGAA